MSLDHASSSLTIFELSEARPGHIAGRLHGEFSTILQAGLNSMERGLYALIPEAVSGPGTLNNSPVYSKHS